MMKKTTAQVFSSSKETVESIKCVARPNIQTKLYQWSVEYQGRTVTLDYIHCLYGNKSP